MSTTTTTPASIARDHESSDERSASTPLWTLQGCLHANKFDLVRFLAEETSHSFSSLIQRPKETLAELLCGLLNQDPALGERAVQKLPVVLGLTPRELEAQLRCTRTERRRWVAEGRLPICATMRVCVRDTTWVEVNLVDRRVVDALSPTTTRLWREEHRRAAGERRQAAILRGVERRAQTLAVQRQARQRLEALRATWLAESSGNSLAVTALTVAFWTVWVSRRAKWYQVEASNRGRAPRGRPVVDWYSYKDQALRLLYQTGWLSAAWYQPDMLWIEELCEEHFDEWREEREYLHTSFGEFVAQHEKELHRCSSCSRDPLHYALYSLHLSVPEIHDSTFRFHVPYSVGKDFLPEPKSLPRALETEESSGHFRFGRPLQDEEELTYTAPFLERHFSRALGELRLLLPGTVADPAVATTAPDLNSSTG